MKQYLLIFALLTIISAGCNKDDTLATSSIYEQNTIDYSCKENWYQTDIAVDPNLCDVFYILETCTNDWTDSLGNIHHFANLESPQHRDLMTIYMKRACDIFGDSTNFFSPYYRQLTIEPWIEGLDSVATYYPQAHTDIKTAFDYYMTNLNNGRRYALAGFSQGGKAVKELIKTMTDEQYNLMSAAYVIGFPILKEDTLASNRFIPAQTATDKGVTISYNSVSDINGIGEFFSNSTMIINPVNWTTTSETAQVNDSVTVSINQQHMALLVDGLNPEEQYIPDLAPLFPKGNYHLLELPLYEEHLRKNIKERLYN